MAAWKPRSCPTCGWGRTSQPTILALVSTALGMPSRSTSSAIRKKLIDMGRLLGAAPDFWRLDWAMRNIPQTIRQGCGFLKAVRCARTRSEEHTSELQSHVNLV